MSTYNLYVKVIVTGESLVLAERRGDREDYEKVLAEHNEANKAYDAAVLAELKQGGF